MKWSSKAQVLVALSFCMTNFLNSFFPVIPVRLTADHPFPSSVAQCIFSRHGRRLHVHLHLIAKPPLWSSSFPRLWQFHLRHPVFDVCSISSLHMSTLFPSRRLSFSSCLATPSPACSSYTLQFYFGCIKQHGIWHLLSRVGEGQGHAVLMK